MDQISSKIEVWRTAGQVWRPLGPSWAIQRIFEGILDRLGGVLEASWAGKVANMAPTWLPKWSQDGPKIHRKIDRHLFFIFHYFLLFSLFFIIFYYFSFNFGALGPNIIFGALGPPLGPWAWNRFLERC